MTNSRLRPLVALVSVAVALAPASAQWTTERHRLLPTTVPIRTLHGDMDGDGDLDLVYSDSGSLYVLTNDGGGRFQRAAATIGSVTWWTTIALGDIDGDGDLDVAAGGSFSAFGGYQPARLFRNDGGGVWSDVSSQWASVSEATTALRFFDFDGDGDQDILTLNPVLGQVVSVQPTNRLYLNGGTGAFTDVTAIRMPAASNNNTSVAIGDIDGDGDRDIVLTTARLNSAAGGTIRVLRQNALGIALEAPGLVPHTPTPYGGYWDVALFDFDNDGDLDLAAASTYGLQFFTNSGGGTFALTQTHAEPSVVRWTPADFDGDGRMDLLATRTLYNMPLPCQLYRNLASGFVDSTTTRFEVPETATGGLLAFDVEQDGDVDVLGSSSLQPLLWHNDGLGRLLHLQPELLCRPSAVAALAADSDLDGDIDLLVHEQLGGSPHVGAVYVASNHGQGPTSPTQSIVPLGLQNPVCMAWIDADLDGDMDVFVGSRGVVGLGTTPRDYLYHQIAGTFVDRSATQLPGGGPTGGGGTRTVTVGDVDGDGRPDLLSPHRIYRNSGPAGFVDASSVLPPLPASVIVAADAWLDFRR